MRNVFLKDNYKVRGKLACSANETSCLLNTFDTARICNTSPKQEPAKSLTRIDVLGLFEPRYEKTGILHMRKQRRRSAAQ